MMDEYKYAWDVVVDSFSINTAGSTYIVNDGWIKHDTSNHGVPVWGFKVRSEYTPALPLGKRVTAPPHFGYHKACSKSAVHLSPIPLHSAVQYEYEQKARCRINIIVMDRAVIHVYGDKMFGGEYKVIGHVWSHHPDQANWQAGLLVREIERQAHVLREEEAAAAASV